MTLKSGTQTLRRIQVAKTRLANATAYAAGDVISEHASTGTAWAFSDITQGNGLGGWITKAWIQTTTAFTAELTLLLFAITPTSELDDNLANTGPIVADTEEFIGAISFPALRDLGTGQSYTVATPNTSGGLPLRFNCEDGDNAIYGILVAEGAFTPGSAQVITIELTVDQER
jgi:hypothetical protein